MNIEQLYQEFLSCSGISTDTRQDLKGKIFIALKGENYDANTFVTEALAQGCCLAVCERSDLAGREKVMVVDSALETLQELARHHRRQLGIPVLAITGSNGKTTTKELVAAVLGRRYRVAFTQGNYNNHIGVPLTLLSILDGVEIAVIEMGANHAGEIALLASIAEPDTGMIINAGKAHLEGFGSEEGVLQAKGELYDYLAASGGRALVDAGEQRLLRKASESRVETMLVGNHLQVEPALQIQPGLRTGTVLQAEPLLLDEMPFLEIDLELNGSSHHALTRLVGTYNLQNIRMAAAAGLYFKVPEKEIVEAIAAYRPSNHRSQLLEGGRNRVVLDSYNANPSSMRPAIKSFAGYSTGPRMLILGDMAELGDSTAQEHLDLALWLDGLCSEAVFEEVYLVGPNFNGLQASLSHLRLFPDREALEAYLRESRPEGWDILLKGSRVMQLERLGPVLWEDKKA